MAAAYRHKLTLLSRLGFDVGLICPFDWAGQTFEPSAADEGYWIKKLPIAWNGKNHFHYYRGLAAAVAEFRPDVLNVEEEHYSAVTYQAFRLAKRHGAAPLFYTWQNIAKKYPPPFSWIERSVFAAAKAGVCGNHEAAEILRAKGFTGETPEIPQMGVNLALFAPKDPAPAARAALRQELGLPDAALTVGYVGRLVEEKGVPLLLDALSMIQGVARLPAVHGVILGAGPEEAKLRTQVARLGLEGRVTFVGTVPSESVAGYLKAIDVLCLPSLTRRNWKEQFGRVLIEAMAAEAIIVGSSSGEIPEVIGDAGLVFKEGHSTSLMDCLAQLAVHTELATELRAKGRARVRRLYTNDVVAGRWAELFARQQR